MIKDWKAFIEGLNKLPPDRVAQYMLAIAGELRDLGKLSDIDKARTLQFVEPALLGERRARVA